MYCIVSQITLGKNGSGRLSLLLKQGCLYKYGSKDGGCSSLKEIVTVGCEGGVTGSGASLGSQYRVSSFGSCGVHRWIESCNLINSAPIHSKLRTGLLDLMSKVIQVVLAIQSSGYSSGYGRNRRG